MATILIRLIGPQQSWGTQSRHHYIRESGGEPSKSGVVGLICAALGRDRSEAISDLAALRMGIRVDREGQVEMDYHTTGLSGYRTAQGHIRKNITHPTQRYYLSDAAFLVGLEGDAELLNSIDQALQNPRWTLSLGRKPFVPSDPIRLPDGLSDALLLDALSSYPWLGRKTDERPEELRVVLDDPNGNDMRQDVPLSFLEREFTWRPVSSIFLPVALLDSGELED